MDIGPGGTNLEDWNAGRVPFFNARNVNMNSSGFATGNLVGNLALVAGVAYLAGPLAGRLIGGLNWVGKAIHAGRIGTAAGVGLLAGDVAGMGINIAYNHDRLNGWDYANMFGTRAVAIGVGLGRAGTIRANYEKGLQDIPRFGRFIGRNYNRMMGRPVSAGVSPKVQQIGDEIIQLLCKGAQANTNQAGDVFIKSQDGLREIRFDFNRPYPHKSPHTHLIRYKPVKNNKVEIQNRRIFHME